MSPPSRSHPKRYPGAILANVAIRKTTSEKPFTAALGSGRQSFVGSPRYFLIPIAYVTFLMTPPKLQRL
jgi:hypothetical protein